MTILETPRLLLRLFKETDLEIMSAMNQDPRVMEYFPSLPDTIQTKLFLDKIQKHFDKYGFTLYACERKDTKSMIGFIGLLMADFPAPFTPAVEIGWRLSYDNWGQGFATEGAEAVLDYGFEQHNLKEIVSFTSIHNIRSQQVMKKIGLSYNPEDDFRHPNIDRDHILSHHVLYRLKHDAYLAKKSL